MAISEFVKNRNTSTREFFADAVPDAGGPYVVGDICWNTGPAADEYAGWVNVAAGSPGTWAGFAVIADSPDRYTGGTAAPTTGAHLKGEIVWNNSPDAEEYAGWVCVTAGTPGTWQPIAPISAGVPRHVAATAAPTTGAHVKGEVVWNSNLVDDGYAGFVCVEAGTPGTWVTFALIHDGPDRHKTAAAVPTTGTHAKGEVVWNTQIAASEYLGFVCLTAGTPGTWAAFGPISDGVPRHVAAAAAPSTGAHVKGEIVWNNDPAAGGHIGFVCTVAGTPGTWLGFGAIAAS